MKKKLPPANPVTEQGRDAFALQMRKWQDSLNMGDWRIEISTRPAGKANAAEVFDVDLEARLAQVRIGKDFGGTPVTDRTIEEIACHEAWHIRLAELIAVCRNPASTDEEVAGVEHALIHVAVRLCVPPDPLVIGKD